MAVRSGGRWNCPSHQKQSRVNAGLTYEDHFMFAFHSNHLDATCPPNFVGERILTLDGIDGVYDGGDFAFCALIVLNLVT